MTREGGPSSKKGEFRELEQKLLGNLSAHSYQCMVSSEEWRSCPSRWLLPGRLLSATFLLEHPFHLVPSPWKPHDSCPPRAAQRCQLAFTLASLAGILAIGLTAPTWIKCLWPAPVVTSSTAHLWQWWTPALMHSPMHSHIGWPSLLQDRTPLAAWDGLSLDLIKGHKKERERVGLF